MAEETVPVDQREQTDPQALRAEIANTRQRLGETLQIVQERLSPHYLKAQAVKIMKQRSREAGDRIRDSIRENPWPLLVTGAGVTWMIGSISRHHMQTHAESQREPAQYRREERQGVTEQARQQTEQWRAQAEDVGQRASQRASEMGQQVSQRASEMGHQVSERASHMTEQMRGQSQQALGSVRSSFKQHPLTMGLATLAAGLAAGLLIPASRKEQQWMGERSRDVMADAKHYGQDLMERGKHVAEQTFESAREEAREEARAEAEDFQRHVKGGSEQEQQSSGGAEGEPRTG